MGLNKIKIYLDKIKAKDYQIAFQKMVLDISFNFMSINQQNFDENVNDLLGKIGSFFNVDRTYLFTLNNNNNTMTYSHEWCSDGINPEVRTIEEIPLEVFPWWIDQLNKNNLVYVEDVNFMPAEASTEQEQLYRQDVKSLVSVPIIVEEKIQAFIGIDSVTSTKKWTEENIELLQIMAKILSGGINQINFDKKIDFMAYHDALTGLPNRLLLIDRVNQGIIRARSQETLISIMFIDIDGFKMINDTLGHDQGDELLKQLSIRLLSVVRKRDTVCRQGGDEFILYLNDYKDEDNLDVIASKVIDIFTQPFILCGREHFITASLGISQYPIDGDDVPTLIKNADIAMFKAKSLGNNQYYKCSNDLKNSTLENISLINDLYMAIERNEMILYYQPQVNGSTGEILGVEVLLRWKHPQFGFVSPFKFIPLTEKTRLILSIGNWVLKTACKQCKEWQEKGFKTIKFAINFSVHQLIHPGIIEQIEDVLEENSLEAKYLEVEITESTAMDTNDKIKETFEKIKNIGVTLAIDDFGKEYSSLNRIKGLPVDKVKIDMSFVQGIGVSNKDETITRAIISLASDLGFKIIAEGVETKEQMEFLNQCMCDQMQGYYFYKPMPAHEMEDVLANLSKDKDTA